MRINFEKDTNADFQEKVGNFCLKPLRLAFGKSVEVRELNFKERETPLALKIGAIFASFLLLPLTVLIGAVGAGFTFFSKTYKEGNKDYQAFMKNTRHVEVQTYIKGVVKFMIFADKQLRELSKALPQGPRGVIGDQPLIQKRYKPFTFNKEEWEKRAEALQRMSESSAKKIEDECRLDAVEALAEININPGFFDAKINLERRKDRESIQTNATYLEEIILDVEQLDYLPLLSEAIKSVTGRVFIQTVSVFREEEPIIPAPSDDKKFGPYINAWLFNLENGNWGCHYYKRMGVVNNYCLLHIDLFKGHKEGDRVVIPADTEREQVILRLNSIPFNRIPFEKKLRDDLQESIKFAYQRPPLNAGEFYQTLGYAEKVLSEISS